MRLKFALAVLFVLSVASPALAEQDFYGIKMKNELWAWNLVMNIGPKADENDLLEGPVLDHSVFAEALVRNIPASGDHTEFMLNVVNNSSDVISTEYDSRDFILHMKDGKIVPLIDTESQAVLSSILPKKSLTFTPSLGNLRVLPENIRMIECSFDLGRTRLFLFPASMKTAITPLRNPPPPLAPKKGSKKNSPKNFWDWMSMKPRASKVPSADPSGAATQGRVDRAIRDFKYVPTRTPNAPAGPASSAIARKETAIDRALVDPSSSGPTRPVRSEAQVIEYNKTYQYVTFNLGVKDGLYEDMLINIVRNGRLVARARVRQVREEAAAASVLPEYREPDIRPGDQISLG